MEGDEPKSRADRIWTVVVVVLWILAIAAAIWVLWWTLSG